MTVNLYRLRGVEKQLSRIADLLEVMLEERYGVRTRHREPARRDEEDDTGVSYVDEEGDWLREQLERSGIKPKEEEQDA